METEQEMLRLLDTHLQERSFPDGPQHEAARPTAR
jgi:hypothetical protein